MKVNNYYIMKKYFVIIILCVVIITGCSFNNKKNYTKREKMINDNSIVININNKDYSVNLENNETVRQLIKVLPLEIKMDDLNGNEKYAYLDTSLLANIESINHINAGDIMLFGDNCLVIFYKSFDTTYKYTKIGHIDNLPNLDNSSINVKLRK